MLLINNVPQIIFGDNRIFKNVQDYLIKYINAQGVYDF